MKLSEEQLAAVRHKDGPALCIAGPGSGKTAVIINRAKNLLDMGVKPEEILVVTFAKAAARSMERRFFELTGIAGVRFSTIHSLCWHIINTGNEAEVSLIPEKIKKCVIISMLSGSVYQSADERRYRDICMEISRFKACLEEAEPAGAFSEKEFFKRYDTHFADKDAFEKVFVKYSSFLKQNSYYDFDDMTRLARKRLMQEPQLKKKSLSFKYIMADEFQDTSIPQLFLLKEIADCINIFAVGEIIRYKPIHRNIQYTPQSPINRGFF